jgi:DNA-binding CsgD family transcriptional regulator
MALLERDRETAAALEYADDAARGHGRLLLVAGEPGVGKSTFVRRLCDVLAGRCTVVRGSCDGASTPAPLAPVAEMLPALGHGLRMPEDGSGAAGRLALFSSLVEVLRDPGPAPVVLVVEDLHWADEATLDLVRHLSRRVDRCRALVVATYRPEDSAGHDPLLRLLGDVATDAGTRRLDLAPLSPAAVRALAETHAADDPDGDVPDPELLHRITGGNAFFVTEVLSAGGSDVPVTVADAVAARTTRLPAQARAAVDVVAVCGQRTGLDLLEELLPEGIEVLDEPVARGVLVLDGSSVLFRHELARLAVEGRVPAPRRVAIHRQVLDALERRASQGHPVDPARLAAHADAATDAAAVRRHAPVAAARASELGAHREAALQLRRALRFADEDDPSTYADLLERLSYECYLTGAIGEAYGVRTRARRLRLGLGDPVAVGRAERWLSRLSWFESRNADAERFAQDAVRTLEAAPPAGAGALPELALAYSNLAQLRMLDGDLAGTRAWAGRALELAARLPEGPERTEVTVHATNNLGTAELTAGSTVLGTELLEQSLAQAREHELHEHAARAFCNLVAALVDSHEHAQAARHLEDGLAYTRDRDLDSWELYLAGQDARARLLRGDPSVERAARPVLRRSPPTSVSLVAPLTALALHRARAGQDGWREPLERAAGIAELTAEPQRLLPVAQARCEIAWLEGDDAAAQAHAAAAWPAALRTDSPWERGTIATWLPDEIDVDGVTVARPYAAERAGRWLEAAQAWHDLGSPFERGLALARSRERAALDDAIAVFSEIGAVVAADRARAHMRARGWTPATARRSAAVGIGALTPRESEVLALVAEGLSDAAIAERLVLSRRTVEHHVASARGKLGVSTRQQAAAHLGSRRPGDG